MRIFEMEQRSVEWYKVRCGVPTASEFDKIITTKGAISTQRKKYLYQLAGERLGGVVDETYQSFAMQQGVLKEGEARNLYNIASGDEVKQVGFCLSDDGKYGCSPDGLVGKDGAYEVKCPLIHTHIGYLIENDVPTDYYTQVQGQLLVTGRKWTDFMSYFPGLKPLIVREEPDEVFHKLLKKALEEFTNELDDLVKRLSK